MISRLRGVYLLLWLLLSVLLSSHLGCSDYSKEVPGLIRKLHSTKASERNDAALRLGRIGAPAAEKAVGSLIGLLDDPNKGVQSAAAYALRKIDTDAARAALTKAQQRSKRKR